MTNERVFRLGLGCVLLALLCLDLTPLLPLISAWLAIDAPRHPAAAPRRAPGPSAEGGLRLILAALLLLSVYGWPQLLWFLPWFLGFALIGAGLSGICPIVALLRRAGMH